MARVQSNDVDCIGWTEFHHASFSGDISMLQHLIAEGTSVNVIDSSGRTAIHIACSVLHFEVISLLVNLGCSVTIEDVKSCTALWYLLRAISLNVDWQMRITSQEVCIACSLLYRDGMNFWQYPVGKERMVFGNSGCGIPRCFQRDEPYRMVPMLESSIFQLATSSYCDISIVKVIVGLMSSSFPFPGGDDAPVGSSGSDSLSIVNSNTMIQQRREVVLCNNPSSPLSGTGLICVFQIRQAVILAIRRRQYRLLVLLCETYGHVLVAVQSGTKEGSSMYVVNDESFLRHAMCLAIQSKVLRNITYLLKLAGRDDKFHASYPLRSPTVGTDYAGQSHGFRRIGEMNCAVLCGDPIILNMVLNNVQEQGHHCVFSCLTSAGRSVDENMNGFQQNRSSFTFIDDLYEGSRLLLDQTSGYQGSTYWHYLCKHLSPIALACLYDQPATLSILLQRYVVIECKYNILVCMYILCVESTMGHYVVRRSKKLLPYFSML